MKQTCSIRGGKRLEFVLGHGRRLTREAEREREKERPTLGLVRVLLLLAAKAAGRVKIG